MNLKIISNLPSVTITLSHNGEVVYTKVTGALATSYLNSLDSELKELTEEVVFENLNPGLYDITVMLPYYDSKCGLFPMPVVSNFPVTLRDSMTLSFKTEMKIVQIP